MSHYLTLKKIGQAVAYYPNLTKKLGNVNASILLSQFIYWHDKTEHPLGVYKTQSDIQAETGLSRKEQETGRKVLRELGLITETYKRTEHKLYFLFHPDAFDAWFSDEAMPESDIRECDKVALPMPESDIPPMPESDIRYIHKNTNENTQESRTRTNDENQKNGEGLTLDIEQIKTRFAMAGIIPSTGNVLANSESIGQELYQFNQYYSHLYMTESQAYAKLIAWFKRIKDRGNLGQFFKTQESVPAGAANSFVAPLPIRGVAK